MAIDWVSTGVSIAGALGGLGGSGGNKAAARLQKAAMHASMIQSGAQKGQNLEMFYPDIQSGNDSGAYLDFLMGTNARYGYDEPPPTRAQIAREYAAEIKAVGLGAGKKYGLKDRARSEAYTDELFQRKYKEWQDRADAWGKQQISSGTASTNGFGSLMSPFTQKNLDEDVVYQNGLQWGLDEGRKAIEARARASGSNDSGSVLKELTQYGNDYATTKSQDAWNRDTATRSRNFDMLNTMANRGLSAKSNLASVNSSLTSGGASNLITSANNIGNYQVAGAENKQNAVQSLLGNLLYSYKNSRNAGVGDSNAGYTGGYSRAPSPFYS